MTIKRIQVKETQTYWGDFTGTLESIIFSLQGALNDGWEGIGADCEPYEDYPSFYLYKHREETEKEYAKRLKQLDKEKAEKEIAKQRKLNQLKKDLDSLSAADKKQLGIK